MSNQLLKKLKLNNIINPIYSISIKTYTQSNLHHIQSNNDSEAYCLNLIRNRDHDHYLISLFNQKPYRRSYLALRAFNLEIASIKETVSNVDIGNMRCLFWKETIDNIIKNKPPQHPIALEISNAYNKTKLSSSFLKRLIDERSKYLAKESFHTLEDLETYSENTQSTLHYLHLELLGIADVKIDHIVSHLGKAAGIVQLLRALPHHLERRSMVLPEKVMAKWQLSEEQCFRNMEVLRENLTKGNQIELVSGFQDAVFEVATRANDHMITAITMLKQLQQESPQLYQKIWPVIISGVPVQRFLKRLEKVDFNVLDQTLKVRDWKLPIEMWFKNYKMRIDDFTK